ncbi:MAG: hypothetical protein M3444_11455 [Acidobacteriota bacterium]|nr:hypothetical protein [Acidobacteriota bacterium]MDQ5837557.1 hypothetical protein [Acidobacteriota bacterium]
MRLTVLFAAVLSLLCLSNSAAQRRSPSAAGRAQLLRELRKCVHPEKPGCSEDSVDRVAELYKQGDTGVLPKLMDVAPRSDGALSESLGVFFSDLLCHKPRTFLRAVATRPRSEHDRLLNLAATADGGGMGCHRGMARLRRRLKEISRNRNDRLAGLAKRCLAQVNEHNPAR